MLRNETATLVHFLLGNVSLVDTKAFLGSIVGESGLVDLHCHVLYEAGELGGTLIVDSDFGREWPR